MSLPAHVAGFHNHSSISLRIPAVRCPLDREIGHISGTESGLGRAPRSLRPKSVLTLEGLPTTMFRLVRQTGCPRRGPDLRPAPPGTSRTKQRPAPCLWEASTCLLIRHSIPAARIWHRRNTVGFGVPCGKAAKSAWAGRALGGPWTYRSRMGVRALPSIARTSP